MMVFLFAELCSGESLPEVEIISLLEEQIPRYKLRADTLTKFGGEYGVYYCSVKFYFRGRSRQILYLLMMPKKSREILVHITSCVDANWLIQF